MFQWLHTKSSFLLIACEYSGGWIKSLEACTHTQDLEDALGSWLWICSALAIVLFRVNQWMGNLFKDLL